MEEGASAPFQSVFFCCMLRCFFGFCECVQEGVTTQRKKKQREPKTLAEACYKSQGRVGKKERGKNEFLTVNVDHYTRPSDHGELRRKKARNSTAFDALKKRGSTFCCCACVCVSRSGGGSTSLFAFFFNYIHRGAIPSSREMSQRKTESKVLNNNNKKKQAKLDSNLRA